MYKNFEEIGVPHYTDEELAYAQAIVDGYELPGDKLPGKGRPLRRAGPPEGDREAVG